MDWVPGGRGADSLGGVAEGKACRCAGVVRGTLLVIIHFPPEESPAHFLQD